MIEGLIGIAVAFIFFILILVFHKRTPNPSIADPLNRYLSLQGFRIVESNDPIHKQIKEALKLSPSPIYIEQIYKRLQDDTVICWISSSTEGSSNSLVSALPQSSKSDKWIITRLPSVQGMLGNLIKKSYSMSLTPKDMYKVEQNQISNQFDLYVQKDSPVPTFSREFIDILGQCGNFVIRSTGTTMLIERISTVVENIEQEARELIRITQMIKQVI